MKKKLVLKKIKIAVLNEKEQQQIEGGFKWTQAPMNCKTLIRTCETCGVHQC